jgi:hypothetical protein
MTNEHERCPICYVMSLTVHTDENEKCHSHCSECGYDSKADQKPEVQLEDWELEARRTQAMLENQDTPLGEQIDGGNDHVADEAFGDNFAAHFDDDPNPYAGTYSEE